MDKFRVTASAILLFLALFNPHAASASDTTSPAELRDYDVILKQLAPGHQDAYDLERSKPVNLDIRFEVNSSKLSPDSRVQLRELGKALASKRVKGARFLIIGHTDASGDASYNKQLSLSRARAVVTFLKREYGIPQNRLIAEGRGEEDLINPTAPDATANRRVEVRLLSPTNANAHPAPTENGTDWGPNQTVPQKDTGLGEQKIRW